MRHSFGILTRRYFSTTNTLRQATVRSTENLPPRTITQYAPLSRKNLYSLIWDQPPTNICVVKKPWNPNVRSALITFVSMLHKEYPRVNIIVESDCAEEIQPDLDDDVVLHTGSLDKTDLMVTLGGDGTILHAAGLFSNAVSTSVPPVLSFSMGTLGFLLPYDFKDAQTAFHDVYTSQCNVMNRFRLECELENSHKSYAMNDITIHRGLEPHLTMLDISVDGEFVTTAIADGVTIATPTGSTAYSLSSGGSIVHPSVSCVLITPICPRSLSFRPLVFPSSSKIGISVAPQSRGRHAEMSVDGLRKGSLKPGDNITVQAESGPGVWCVVRTDSDWIQHLNNLLGFNSTFGVRHYELTNNFKNKVETK